MKTILKINASLVPEQSKSLKLSDHYVNLIKQKASLSIITRDLSIETKNIDGSWIASAFTPEENRTAYQNDILTMSNSLIEEIRLADEIVLSTPMYNFTVPANLKTYFDLIARIGVTFRYTEQGPVGLIEDKPVIVIISTGGTKIGSEHEFMSPYITQMFNFIGITNVTIVASDIQSKDADLAMKDANNILTNMANKH